MLLLLIAEKLDDQRWPTVATSSSSLPDKNYSDKIVRQPLTQVTNTEKEATKPTPIEQGVRSLTAMHEDVQRKRILGMRPRTLMIGALMLLAIIVAAVLGGVLGSRKSSHSSE